MLAESFGDLEVYLEMAEDGDTKVESIYKRGVGILLACLALAPAAWAQQKTLASTMDVYVFPTKGQDASQQSQDEAECYNWAVGNTGSDPFDLAKQAQSDQAKYEQQKAQAEQTSKGRTGKSALGGAAGGALIGVDLISDAAQFSANVGADSFVRGALLGQGGDNIAHQINVDVAGIGRVRDVGLLIRN